MKISSKEAYDLFCARGEARAKSVISTGDVRQAVRLLRYTRDSRMDEVLKEAGAKRGCVFETLGELHDVLLNEEDWKWSGGAWDGCPFNGARMVAKFQNMGAQRVGAVLMALLALDRRWLDAESLPMGRDVRIRTTKERELLLNFCLDGSIKAVLPAMSFGRKESPRMQVFASAEDFRDALFA